MVAVGVGLKTLVEIRAKIAANLARFMKLHIQGAEKTTSRGILKYFGANILHNKFLKLKTEKNLGNSQKEIFLY